jgi:hypothetical protein
MFGGRGRARAWRSRGMTCSRTGPWRWLPRRPKPSCPPPTRPGQCSTASRGTCAGLSRRLDRPMVPWGRLARCRRSSCVRSTAIPSMGAPSNQTTGSSNRSSPSPRSPSCSGCPRWRYGGSTCARSGWAGRSDISSPTSASTCGGWVHRRSAGTPPHRRGRCIAPGLGSWYCGHVVTIRTVSATGALGDRCRARILAGRET